MVGKNKMKCLFMAGGVLAHRHSAKSAFLGAGVVGIALSCAANAQADSRFVVAKDSVLAVSEDAMLFGGNGYETVRMVGAVNLVLDGNIEQVEMSNSSRHFSIAVTGTRIHLTSASAGSLVINGLNQPMTLVFDDRTAILTLTGLDQANLDGVTLSSLPTSLSQSETDLSILFTDEPEDTTLLRYAELAFSAPDATTYECNLDEAGFLPCESPYFLLDVAEGQHAMTVRAGDNLGAWGNPVSTRWLVDSLMSVGHPDLVSTNVSPSAVDPNSWRGIFRINCDFAHSSYNDPIVFPGLENAAHLHRFYGNVLTDHTSDVASIYTQGDSSCQGNSLNRSAYWVPALLAPLFDQKTGAPVLDSEGDQAWQVVPAVVGNDDEAHEVFYYSAGVDDLSSIQVLPAGLRMIAGQPTTLPGEAQDTAIVRWHCQTWESSDATNPRFSATIPECKEPDRVRLDIFFPSCWNGKDLDSADHRSHMAYPISGSGRQGTVCPESHPVPVMRVSYHYAFGVKPAVSNPATQSSRGWRLASDMYEVTDTQAGGLSLHGDWFNGWHPGVLEAILKNCIQGELDCHDGNLANGYRLSGTQPGSQVEPEIYRGGMGL